MKVIKSKLSIALAGFGVASLVGAVAVATYVSASEMPTDPPKDKKVSAKVPHRQVLETYLDSMKSYLQTPPRDGIFGSDRIPMLHGKESEDVPGYAEIKALKGKSRIRSAVIGLYPEATLKSQRDQAKADGVPFDEIEAIRMNYVHFLSPEETDNQQQIEAWEKGTAAMEEFAVEMRKKGKDVYSKTQFINGKQAWILAKAVKASEKSCYKCHANVKKGEAIGYVVAMVTNP